MYLTDNVTIIVLLILAGVIVVTLTGENGIFNRAKTGKEIYQNTEEDEKIKISNNIL